MNTSERTAELIGPDVLSGLTGVFGNQISNMIYQRYERKFYGLPNYRHSDDPFFNVVELVIKEIRGYLIHRTNSWVFVVDSHIIKSLAHVYRVFGPFRKRSNSKCCMEYCNSLTALSLWIMKEFARKGRLLHVQRYINTNALIPVYPCDVRNFVFPESVEDWVATIENMTVMATLGTFQAFADYIRAHHSNREVYAVTSLLRGDLIFNFNVIDPLIHTWFDRKRFKAEWPTFRKQLVEYVRNGHYFDMQII